MIDRKGLARPVGQGWRALAGAGVVAVSGLAACGDSPVDIGVESYALVSINGQMPGPYPDPAMPPNTFEVTAGSLTLKADGTMTLELTARCRSSLPPGTECSVQGDGRASTEGRYFRADGHAEGEIELADRRYPAIFEGNAVTIDLVTPPSMGWTAPRFLLEFRR